MDRKFFWTGAISAFFTLACWGAVHGDEGPAALAAEVKRIFRNRCFECHGDTRRESDLHIFETSEFVGAEGVVVPGDVDASYLFERIATDDEDYRMPEAP